MRLEHSGTIGETRLVWVPRMALHSNLLSRGLAFGLRWLSGLAALGWYWRLLRRQARWSVSQIRRFPASLPGVGPTSSGRGARGAFRLGPSALLRRLSCLADDEAAAWAGRLEGLRADLVNTSVESAYPREAEYLDQAGARQLQAKLIADLFARSFRHRPTPDQVGCFALYQHSSEAFADFLECCRRWGLLDSRESVLAGIPHFTGLLRQSRDTSRKIAMAHASQTVVLVVPGGNPSSSDQVSTPPAGSGRAWREWLPGREDLLREAPDVGNAPSPRVRLRQRTLSVVYWGKDHLRAAGGGRDVPSWVLSCLDETLQMDLEALRDTADYRTGRVQEVDRGTLRGVLAHALAVQACGLACRLFIGLPEAEDPDPAVGEIQRLFARLLLGAHAFGTAGRDPESAMIHGDGGQGWG